MRGFTACRNTMPTPPRSRCFFFFQAEDGIRDLTVTGVQTCALPISDSVTATAMAYVHVQSCTSTYTNQLTNPSTTISTIHSGRTTPCSPSIRSASAKIGRASCRERVEISAAAVSLQKQHAHENAVQT